MKNYLLFYTDLSPKTPENTIFAAKQVYVMVKTLIFALLATMCAAFLWGCGGKVSYTTVDGTMLGTTLHVVADVQGTSPQELYAAVMALDREAKASM